MTQDTEGANGPAGPLARLEALDRLGHPLAAITVRAWPLTVGRALDCDVVLDDPHLAARHLTIERAGDGPIRVTVGQSINGVRLGRRLWRAGEQFDWPAGQELSLGRLRLALRRADDALAPEQALAQLPWRSALPTAVALAALMAIGLVQAWLDAGGAGRPMSASLPALAGWIIGGLGAWAGLWSLVTKVFAGRLCFWRHVRIACTGLVAMQLALLLAALAAFSLSWEAASRFDWVAVAALAAAMLLAHLWTVAPAHRRALAGIAVLCWTLGCVTAVSLNWSQNRRVSRELYMASFFPPSWRLAGAAPVASFISQSREIKARLDARLRDAEADSESGDEPAGEE